MERGVVLRGLGLKRDWEMETEREEAQKGMAFREIAFRSASEMTPLASETTPVSMKSAWGVASTEHVAAVTVGGLGAWSESVEESHELRRCFLRLRVGLVESKEAGAVCDLEDVVERPLPPVGAIAVDCQSCGDTLET